MKSYLITGAGSGMGRATAIAMAEKGHRIVLVGRTLSHLEETRALMNSSEAHHIACLDIRDSSAWKQFYAQPSLSALTLDGVFANAGIGGENHYGETDRWDEILTINLTGSYVTIMEALPYLRRSTSPFKHIVFTSSCLARFGVPNYTAYCTSKAGLLGLTRSLAVELAAEKILVNAICPGWVETDMAKAGIQKLADRSGQDYTRSFEEQMSYVPLNRISQPEEIAHLILYLMDSRQQSITGQGIDINNGSFMA
jgi:NAD(P)-dependent dehydrogenase (short-subunit alcohol dehydrogenase family)